MGRSGEAHLGGREEVPRALHLVHEFDESGVDRRGQAMFSGRGDNRPVQKVDLGQPLGKTYPDCFWPETDPADPGVCLYLDGLSESLHGSPATAARDRAIREALRAKGYDVFELPATGLEDRGRMVQLFYELGLRLLDRARAKSMRQEPEGWFGW